MTITEFGVHDELGKQRGCEQQDSDTIGTADEINFDMQPIKDALNRSIHERLKTGPTMDPLFPQKNHPSLGVRFTSGGGGGGGSSSNTPRLPDYSNDITKLTTRVPEVTSPPKFDVSSVLPARTRIRRQRRMDSNEAKDPIERLNKLRARISGALSEVKGVLNKYSTETEDPNGEVVLSPSIIKFNSEAPPRVESGKDNECAPIQFRFLKKVRRRSIFSEDGEKTSIDIDNTEQQKPEEENQIANDEKAKIEKTPETYQKNSYEDLNRKTQVLKEPLKTVVPIVEIAETEAEIVPSKEAKKEVEKSFNVSKKLSSSPEHNLDVKDKKNEKRRISIGTIDDIGSSQQTLNTIKTQRRPSDSSAIIGKLSESYLKPFLGNNEKTQIETRAPKTDRKSLEPSDALPEKNKKMPENLLLVKKKDESIRRSSIATVESLKIEPPIDDNPSFKLKTERRPSDSAAIFKKGIENNRSIFENVTGRVPNYQAVALSKRVVENNATNLAANEKNSNDNDAQTPIVSDKQSTMTPFPSINTISNETSESTSMVHPNSAQLLSATPKLLATLIGSPMTATTTTTTAATTIPNALIATTAPTTTVISNGTVIAQHEKAEKSDRLKPSKLPLTTDGPKVAGVAAVSNLSQSSATSSQQIQLNKYPNDQSIINGLTAVSLDKQILSKEPTDNNIQKTDKVSQFNITIQQLRSKVEQQDDVGHKDPTDNDAVRKVTNRQNVIHQQGITSTQPTEVPNSSTQESLSLASAQQVAAASVELAFNATGNGTCAVRDNSETIARKSLSEINASKIGVTANDVATKASATAIAPDSGVQSINNRTESIAAFAKTIPTPEFEKLQQKAMPELQLQVLPVALKAVHVQPESPTDLHPFDEPKESFHKKKFKKVLRKVVHNEKQQIPKAIQTITNKIHEEINVETTPNPEPEPEPENHLESATESSDSTIEESIAKPKAERKVKKKVIIKRVQRKLSGSEQSFFFGSIDEKPSPDVETIEKAIAYVTDDNDDDDEESEPANTINPAKSCMRLREYEVGDQVLYAERYKKTQLRWKKGRVTERITSISYKIDIGGKEVSAHINYLKKYTGRKVRFGDKEYLDIDYEQIPEKETKPQNYSIWNVV